MSKFSLVQMLSQLSQAIRAIFFGSGIERTQPGRPPIGVQKGMTKITAENIAYAATQVSTLTFLQILLFVSSVMCFCLSQPGESMTTTLTSMHSSKLFFACSA